MFTGIIECLGKIVDLQSEGGNLHITLESPISSELKIDQSIAHNGICLTVVKQNHNRHTVTAIAETLEKTTAGRWQVGQSVNLERCVKLGDRMDGHWVQGHVDQLGKVLRAQEHNGSWIFSVGYEGTDNITVQKGSITVNGTSLTVVDSEANAFSVAIIPYTFDNTVFNQLKVGDYVNLEFDVLGKYVARYMQALQR